MGQPATIGLPTAQDRAKCPDAVVKIEESAKGYVVMVDGNPIHSRRQDLLTFLTVDGAFNYARRHLATPAGLQAALVVELHAG